MQPVFIQQILYSLSMDITFSVSHCNVSFVHCCFHSPPFLYLYSLLASFFHAHILFLLCSFCFLSLFLFFIFLLFQLLLEIHICLEGGPDVCPSSTLFPHLHLCVIKISAENNKFTVCISIVLASVPNILSAPSLPQSAVSHTIVC